MTGILRNPARAGETTLFAAFVALAFLSGCGEKDAADKQMQELCAKDGGVKIYETVTLPKSDFSQSGRPLDSYWSGQTDPENRLGPNYRYVERLEYIGRGDTLRGEVQITKFLQKIFRRSDGKLLGESVEYGRSGGDHFINRILGGHPSSSSCPLGPNILFTAIFIKEE